MSWWGRFLSARHGLILEEMRTQERQRADAAEAELAKAHAEAQRLKMKAEQHERIMLDSGGEVDEAGLPASLLVLRTANALLRQRANAADAEVRRLESQLESSRRRYDDELGVRRWVGVDPPTGDVVMMHASQWESAQAEVRRLREAVGNLMNLIHEGWLVRNTTNDGHLPSYLAESARLVNALAYAQAALDADVAPAPTPPAS